MSIDVEIVQPKKSRREAVGILTGSFIVRAIDAWAVMLLIPLISEWHPGFMLVFIGSWVVQTVIGAEGPTYKFWTKRAIR